MGERQYKVFFHVSNFNGDLQDHPELRFSHSAELDAKVLSRFKSALKKKFPDGTLSDDAKIFRTPEPIKLVDETKHRFNRFTVSPLTQGPFAKMLAEYYGHTDYWNEGSIMLIPLAPPKHVSPTAVSVVARNIQVNPSGTGMVGLPDELEQKIKGYGRTTRRQRRKRHSLSSRRKSMRR